jgi:hypothetical protein
MGCREMLNVAVQWFFDSKSIFTHPPTPLFVMRCMFSLKEGGRADGPTRRADCYLSWRRESSSRLGCTKKIKMGVVGNSATWVINV